MESWRLRGSRPALPKKKIRAGGPGRP